MINASTVWYVYQVYTCATSGFSGYIKFAYCRYMCMHSMHNEIRCTILGLSACNRLEHGFSCVACMVFHCVFCGLIEEPHPLEEC